MQTPSFTPARRVTDPGQHQRPRPSRSPAIDFAIVLGLTTEVTEHRSRPLSQQPLVRDARAHILRHDLPAQYLLSTIDH